MNNEGLIISSFKSKGPENMSMDEMLLRFVMERSNLSFAIRIYTWEGNWLSIGKNQKEIPNKWIDLHKLGKIKLVKRPSGGGAVLHNKGLTYSLAWSDPPRKRQQAYLQASKWLQQAFRKVNIELDFGNDLTTSIEENCFNSATCADLIDKSGNKRVGSAQLWRHGHLMQHGEILMNPEEELWFEVFKEKPPNNLGLNLNSNKLEKILLESAKESWPNLKWCRYSFTEEDLKEIKRNNYKYNYLIV